MNKKIFVSCAILALSLIGVGDVVAQNYLHKFGFEINGGLREYGGDRGTRYFLAEKPDYQAVGGSFGYYVNPSFDAIVTASVGELGHRDDSYPRKLGFTAQVNRLNPWTSLQVHKRENHERRQSYSSIPKCRMGWYAVYLKNYS